MTIYVLTDTWEGARITHETIAFEANGRRSVVNIRYHYREFGGSEGGKKKQAAWCTARGPDLRYRSKTVTVPANAPPGELDKAGHTASVEMLEYLTVLHKMGVL